MQGTKSKAQSNKISQNLPSKTDLAKHQAEIQKQVNGLPATKDPVFIARYVGSVGHEKRRADEQSRLRFLGLTMPQIRAVSKHPFAFTSAYFTSAYGVPGQAAVWLDLYHQSEVFEELALCLVALRQAPLWQHMLAHPSLIWGLQARVDNWAISDAVSDYVATLLERNPGKYLGRLQRWNRSKEPWQRRQSLVGLYFYARFRQRPIAVPVADALPLVENLIGDSHYFVQKAVGWCLREIYQLDAQTQRQFVKAHVAHLSAAAFATAIEKYSSPEMVAIKQIRASQRKRLVAGRGKAKA